MKSKSTARKTQKPSFLKKVLGSGFNRTRALLFIVTFATIGTVYLIATQAATLSNPFASSYGNWNSTGGARQMSVDMTYERAPASDGWFSALNCWFDNSNSCGYAGIQANSASPGASASGKMAIFSMWDVGTEMGVPEPNGVRYGFSNEGSGVSVRIPYDWVQGRTYRITIYEEGVHNSNRLWGSTVTDLATGQTSRIGRIWVPVSRGYLRDATTFYERFSGPTNKCSDVQPTQVLFTNFSVSAPARISQGPRLETKNPAGCSYAATEPAGNGYRAIVRGTGGTPTPTAPTPTQPITQPTTNSNPIGYADYCRVESGRTIVYGWAHDNNGDPNVSVVVGGNTQTVASNQGYREGQIDAFLPSQGRTASNTYGFRADFGTLYKDTAYSIGGTIINIGAGSNAALGINTANSLDGGVVNGFPGNRIPSGCLSARGTTTTQPAPTPTPTPTPAPSAGGLTIRNRKSGRCLDVIGMSRTPNLTHLWDCSGGANQGWTASNGNIIVYSGTGNRMCLDVYGGGTANGSQVGVYYCHSGNNQKWTTSPDGTIRSVASGRCLDANGGGTANGTSLIIWDCHGGVNQQWFKQ